MLNIFVGVCETSDRVAIFQANTRLLVSSQKMELKLGAICCSTRVHCVPGRCLFFFAGSLFFTSIIYFYLFFVCFRGRKVRFSPPGSLLLVCGCLYPLPEGVFFVSLPPFCDIVSLLLLVL